MDDKTLKKQGVAAALEEGAVDSNAVTSGGTLSAEATSSFSSSFEPTWYVAYHIVRYHTIPFVEGSISQRISLGRQLDSAYLLPRERYVLSAAFLVSRLDGGQAARSSPPHHPRTTVKAKRTRAFVNIY